MPKTIQKSLARDNNPRFRHLSAHQVVMIAEALDAVGDFGEVRLVVNKGRMRFVIIQRSYDALHFSPGEIQKIS